MSTAYIALGSNLASVAGPPDATLAAAARRLGKLGTLISRSSLYSTKPVGYAAQPRFVNAVVALDTPLEPRSLLDQLLAIEKEFGRDRSKSIPNGPRTLDLDILLIDDIETREAGLELPHPRLDQRAFVLVPLHEIAPQLRIAGRGKTVEHLLEKLHQTQAGDTDAVVRMESNHWRAAAEV
ncbi:MAG TPA: 2-amino-4-hydroxy-6-hydroxymethyldihydropteridine diphosphokinase [Terracidiphilus sp.]|nr:2-amino-4-hydroxy-6-hydroxymethyldihydropteridine diphosphokinase [Terracidiphilus sp.]